MSRTRPASVFLAGLTGCALVCADSPNASWFVPPPGQSYYYRYSETETAPKTSLSLTATLTLKSLSPSSVQVTWAADGKMPRTLDFRVDEAGALQPVAVDDPAMRPKSKAEIQERAMTQQLELLLALVSRLGANRESSFPVPLAVEWAKGPVYPILTVKSTDSNVFVADARASTTVNSPSGDGGLATVGLGLRAVSTFGGTEAVGFVGIAGLGLSALSTLRRPRGPQPADVSLHLAGELANGRLRQLSGDQENVIRPGRHGTTFSVKWMLVQG